MGASSVRHILEGDLARAEAVILASKGRKKAHGPTVHNFEGQALAYKRVLALLEMEQIRPSEPIKIDRTLTINIPWAVLAILTASGILWLL